MISVVIIDYNSIRRTFQYIKDFRENVVFDQDFHFIVVDNYQDSNETLDIINQEAKSIQSLDDSIQKIEMNSFEFVYYKANENLGYAKGNNAGFKIAKELYDDHYCIFSNSDILFKNKVEFSKIIDVFNNKNDIAIVGPHIIGLDEKEQSPFKKASTSYQLFGGMWYLAIPFVKTIKDQDKEIFSKECFWVSGCFFVIKSEAFDKVNGFDEETFLYCEEKILSEKLRKEGYRTYFLNDCTVVHEAGGVVNKTKNGVERARTLFESQLYYSRKYENVSEGLIKIARMNFYIAIGVMRLKEFIKRLI